MARTPKLKKTDLIFVIKTGLVPALDVKVLVVGLFRHDERAEQEEDEAGPAQAVDAQLIAGQGQDDAQEEQGPGDPGEDLPVLAQLLVFRFDVQEAADNEVGADNEE